MQPNFSNFGFVFFHMHSPNNDQHVALLRFRRSQIKSFQFSSSNLWL